MDELQTKSTFPLSLSYLIWIFRGRKFAIAAATLLGLGAAYLFVTIIPPKYAASVQLIFDAATEELVNTEQEVRTRWTGQYAFANAVATIASPGILKPVALKIMADPARLSPPVTPLQKTLAKAGLSTDERVTALIKKLEKDVSVTTPSADQIVVIECKSSNPDEAAYIANLVATTFLEQRAASRKASLAQATAWLDERSLEAKEKLSALDKKIQEFKATNRIENERGSSAVDAELILVRGQLSAVQTRLTEARATYQSLHANAIKSAGDYEKLAESIVDATLERLRSSLVDAESALARAKARLGESHPDVQAQKSHVAAIKAEIAAEARRKQLASKTEVDQLTSRQEALQANVNSLETKVRELRASEVQLLELQREREAIKTLYDSMLAKLMQTSMQQTLNFGQFKILLEATVPKSPKIPSELFLAAGTIVGFGFGLVMTLLWEIFLDRVVMPNDIKKRLSTNLISQVPLISKKDFNKDAVTNIESFKNFAKQFPDSLFTNKLFSAQLVVNSISSSEECKVIMITSPVAGNGKTHICSNLAGLSTFIGKKTLLMDFDARKARDNEGLVNQPAFSALNSFLQDNELGSVFFASHCTGSGDYDVLQVRSSNEAACLRIFHTHTEELLKFVRENYDHAWIDTPPARIFNDPLIIARQVDGVMVVAEWSETTIKQLKDTIGLVQESGGHVMGVIINKVPVDPLISESMVSYGNYYGGRKQYGRG